MIIFGTTTRNATKETGVFNCPRCNLQREYLLKSVNRYFTLYFIPLIPLGSAGQFIECPACGGTFGVEVLSYDPQTARNEVHDTIRRMLVLIMAKSHKTSPGHIGALQDMMQQAAGEHVTAQQIYEDIRLAEEAGVDAAPFIQRQAANFTDNGRLMLLETAIHVLSADGSLGERERMLLREIGRAMNMPTQKVESLLSNGQDGLGRQ